MAVAYTQKNITAGIPYSDTFTITIPDFDIGTQADAVQAAIINVPPSTKSEAASLTETVSLVFASGDRAAGQSSAWNLVFPASETLKLLETNSSKLKQNNVFIQVLVKNQDSSQQTVFTSESIEITANLVGV